MVEAGIEPASYLARRETRLQAIRDAKAEIEARAGERFAREQAEYAAKVKAREDKEKRTGKKSRGKPPTPPTAGPDRTAHQARQSRSGPISAVALWVQQRDILRIQISHHVLYR
jgi:hypothetical protein